MEVRASAAAVPFLDGLLGRGSVESLKRAFAHGGSGVRRPVAVARPKSPPSPAAPRREARMQVVGASDDHLPRGRKGLGRAVLVVLGLASAVTALRPWQKEGLMKADWTALFEIPAQAGVDRPRQQARIQSTEDAAKLAALPLQMASGRPLGLWRDGSGRWWTVDADAALAPCADPLGTENLGLPEISGVSAHAEAYRGGRRLLLNLPPGRLGELLPLRTSVASEVRAVVLADPAQPVLITFNGTRCLMGGGDWTQCQRRLALVLADLAARHRGASQVDLRFEGTAVVRPI